MYCIRGAITAKENTKECIINTSKRLVEEIIEKNELDISDIISIVFTATKDLDKAYPAVGAREIGLTSAALMCLQEMYVENSLTKCIRVMVMAEGKTQSMAKHVYMEGAKILRPDIN